MNGEIYHAGSFSVIVHRLEEITVTDYIVVYHDGHLLEHVGVRINPFQRIVITSEGEVL